MSNDLGLLWALSSEITPAGARECSVMLRSKHNSLMYKKNTLTSPILMQLHNVPFLLLHLQSFPFHKDDMLKLYKIHCPPFRALSQLPSPCYIDSFEFSGVSSKTDSGPLYIQFLVWNILSCISARITL